jgi:hypothetical protein
MIYRRTSKYFPTQYAAIQPDRLIVHRYEVEAIKGYEIRGKGEKTVKSIFSTAYFATADRYWADFLGVDKMERLQRQREYLGAGGEPE